MPKARTGKVNHANQETRRELADRFENSRRDSNQAQLHNASVYTSGFPARANQRAPRAPPAAAKTSKKSELRAKPKAQKPA